MKHGREYHCCEEEYNVEKRKRGCNIIFSLIMKLLGRISSGKEGKEMECFGKNQDLKEWWWRSILSCRELYTTLFKTNRLFTPVCIAGSRIVKAIQDLKKGGGVMDTTEAIYFLKIYIYILSPR